MPKEPDSTELPPDIYDEPEAPHTAEAAQPHEGRPPEEPAAAQEEPVKAPALSKQKLIVFIAVFAAFFVIMFVFALTKKTNVASDAPPPVPTYSSTGIGSEKPTLQDFQSRFPPAKPFSTTGNAVQADYYPNKNSTPNATGSPYSTYQASDAPPPPQPQHVTVVQPAYQAGPPNQAPPQPDQTRDPGFFFPDYQSGGLNSAIGGTRGDSTADALIKATEIQTQTDYQRQNAQAQKGDFLRQQQADYGDYSKNSWSPPVDPTHELKAGWIIPSVLLTDINTDNPGSVEAQVTEDVKDSFTGQRILIQRGSRLLGTYNSDVSFQQNRIQIKWTRLIRTDFVSISLLDSSAVDSGGSSGVPGQVDSHYGDIATAVTVSSAFDLGVNTATAYIAGLPGLGALSQTLQGKQGVSQELSTQIITRVLNRQPTITVQAGTVVNAMILKDIILPETEALR